MFGCGARTFVAQIFNLLYRRFSTCGRKANPSWFEMGTACRLKIGDTAEWNSALLSLRLCRAGERQASPRARGVVLHESACDAKAVTIRSRPEVEHELLRLA